MIFNDILQLVFDRVGEDYSDPDIQALSVIKGAINEAYIMIGTSLDKRNKSTTVNFTGYSAIVKQFNIPLPSDFFSLISIEHSTSGELPKVDYNLIADQVIVRNYSLIAGYFKINYVSFPAFLVNVSDIVMVKDGYLYAIVAYACHLYMITKKKTEAAQAYLNEFTIYIQNSNRMEVDSNDSQGNIQTGAE